MKLGLHGELNMMRSDLNHSEDHCSYNGKENPWSVILSPLRKYLYWVIFTPFPHKTGWVSDHALVQYSFSESREKKGETVWFTQFCVTVTDIVTKYRVFPGEK